MADITVQTSGINGVIPTYVAVSASDTFTNDGKTKIHVKNGGGSSDTVTIDSLTACNQGSDHDGTSAVAAGAERVFGPFEQSRFNNANGKVTVTHSFTTSVTMSVISG